MDAFLNTRYFATNLRCARIARRLTQRDLGRLAGLGQSRVSGLELGLAPTAEQIIAIAQALRLKPADLLRRPRARVLEARGAAGRVTLHRSEAGQVVSPASVEAAV